MSTVAAPTAPVPALAEGAIAAGTKAAGAQADVALTPEQQRFFDVFGFIALRGAISDCIGDVIDAFERVWIEHGGGHNHRPHDGKQRSCIVPFADQSEVLSALLDHPRVHGAACSLLGDDFNYTGSDGNFYVGNTGWHRDGGHTQTRYIKVAYYLDALTGDTGALRVIPGSHRFDETYGREAQQAAANPASVGTDGPGIPAIALDVTPGDLLIFNHNTLHSSWGGGSRRRMFTMNLCQRYPQERLPDFQQYLSGHSRFHIERNVGPKMLSGAGPQRMRHLQQVMENDFLLTQRTRERIAKGEEPARG